MQKTLDNFLILLILVLTTASCTNSKNSKNLDSWVGNYTYEEEPTKAIAGYFMAMTWILSVNKKDDNYQGVLEVNGQQTFIKILSDVSGDGNFVAFTFNKLIDGSDENLKKGDTLFSLLKNGAEIKTRWKSLEPRLTDNPSKECNCFDITKSNGH